MHLHVGRQLLGALAVLPLTLALGCNGASRTDAVTPAGPSAVASGTMAGGGMSGMPGMGGMSMAVTSEFDFLAQMIPHHEEAIMTAHLLEAGTARPEMRAFARTIIDTQSAENRQMRAWLAEWYPGRVPSVTYTPMMRDLTGLRGDALDQAFLTDMIPHHMMAVMMSQQYLMASYARRPETLPFAARIAETQRQEIQMMQAWLRAWFNASGMSH
jgi:uncharacterized protein (DUF305 family)